MTFIKSKYFKAVEFDSPDKPGSGSNMNLSFIDMLDNARDLAGVPFSVNSGYRTPEHNAKEGGVKNSAHVKGHGADIRYDNTIFSRMLNAFLKAGFKRIGIGKTFIHVDNDPSLPQPAVWFYSSTPAPIRELKPKILGVMAATEKKNLPENWLMQE